MTSATRPSGSVRATTWKKAISVRSVLVMDDNDANPDNGRPRRHHRGFPDRVPRQRRRWVRIFPRAFACPAASRSLKMAQEYRNPDNFIRTALVPAIRNPPGHRFADERRRLLRRSPQRIRRRVREPAQRRPVPNQAQGSPRAAQLHSAPDRDPPGRHRAGAFGDNNASQFVTEKVTDARGHPGTQATAVPQVRRRGGGSADHQSSIPTRSTSSAWSRSSRRSPSWRWRGRTA